jgi:predicted peroxiredoxin
MRHAAVQWMLVLVVSATFAGCQSVQTCAKRETSLRPRNDSAFNPGAAAEGKAVRDGVLVHLSKGLENPHAVLMALRMANLMAVDRDVLVYFDLQGVNVVLKDAPDLTFPGFESSQAQLQSLLARGVPLYACPGCLKALGKEPTDLLPGVKIAEKDAFFNFTAGRIVTLDY